MEKILKNSWALFLGIGALMLAYGFQGSLLGVRAVKEEFSLTATGFMMSGYFVGYFIGAKGYQGGSGAADAAAAGRERGRTCGSGQIHAGAES